MSHKEDKERKTWKTAGRDVRTKDLKNVQWKSDKSQIIQIKEAIRKMKKEEKE